jgi:DNA-binding NtrC family response regulator
MKILVVDDQRSARRLLKQMLAELGDVEIVEAGTVADALAAVEQSSPDLLLLDIRLTEDPRDRGGLQILQSVRASGRSTPAVIITASTEMSEIREAMRQGAQDYVFKDELSPEMLLPIVRGFRENMSLRGEVVRLRQRVEKGWGLDALVGSSPPMERLRKLIVRLANADCTVLIRGETGTGKELVARALHELSARRDEPFVAANCSALPGTLIESLIFGHERGAFTGADRRQRGQIELARGGTLLLDEIAEMSVQLQAKLLRVLEDKRFRPLGAETELPVRARIVAATHVDLEKRLADGRFREDLFYRLNVVSIDVPPLVERKDDIVELVAAFCSDLTRKLKFTEQAMAWLTDRQWPGNVRELRNAVERLALLAESEVVDVPVLEELVARRSANAMAEIDRIAKTLLGLPARIGCKLDVIERAVLHHAIEVCDGNRSAAARLIGVERKRMERLVSRLADEPPENDDEGNP